MKTVPSDNLLAATLRAIGDGVISCDRDGTIVMMNPVAEQLTGWPEADAIGKALRDVFVIMHETTRAPVEDPAEKALRTQQIVSLANHTLLIRRDGFEIPIDDSAAPVYNAEGEMRGAVLVFRDVSERRHAEWNLHLLAQAGKVLVNTTTSASVMERIGTLVNQHFADVAIFDLALEQDHLERHVGPHRDPTQQEVVKELYRFIPTAEQSAHPTRAALFSGTSILLNNIDESTMRAAAANEEHFAYFRDRLKPRSVLAVPVQEDGGKLGVLTFIRNVTLVPFNEADRETGEELGARVGAALRNAQLREQLQQEQARLKAVIESVPVGVLVAEPSGKILFGNPEVERIMRHPIYEAETVEEHGRWIAFHPDGRQVRGEEYPLPRAMATGEPVRDEEYVYQRGDGTKAWISLSAAPFTDAHGRITGGVVAIADIDQRKRAVEALAASELSNRLILSSTRDRITVMANDGTLRSMNREGQSRLGIQDITPYLGTSWLNLWKGEQRAEAERALQDALHRGVGRFEGEYLTPSGENTWWDVTVTPLAEEGAAVEQLLAVSREITDRKAVELSLRRSEQRFRTLIECASVGINIGDFKGALSYINPKLLNLLGYTREEVERGEVRWDQLTPAKYVELDHRAIEQLRARGVAEPYEKVYRAKDGRLIPLILGASLIPSMNEDAQEGDIAVFFTDLTNQKKAEAALLQTEKLAAVGKLASTISHEINNPLEAVTNLLYIVRQVPDLPQTAQDYLATADRELARVSQVTAQTLRFHRQSTAARTVSPDALVDEVLQLYAGRLTNSHINVKREYEPKIALTCYEGDVRQVLNNLIGNAIDAMRTGGQLTVRTREAIRWSTGQPGIRITIADTGLGIPKEVLKHIFEAFYTTKGINGTGLGLWISCRIVHKHRGFVRAYSSTKAELRGSVFELWLPLELAESANEPWHQEGISKE